jgi:AsmA protein
MLTDTPFSVGSIAAQLDLQGHGASVATILGAASGTLALTMDGGRISNLVDAKLGLNGGKILRLLIGGDRGIAINTVDVAFDFDKGLGTSTNIFLDTAQTRVAGTGNINLRDETVYMLLTPHQKKPGIFSLRSSSIHVDGSFRHPQFTIVKKGKQSSIVGRR